LMSAAVNGSGRGIVHPRMAHPQFGRGGSAVRSARSGRRPSRRCEMLARPLRRRDALSPVRSSQTKQKDQSWQVPARLARRRARSRPSSRARPSAAR
jgi:hypothetical protein